MTFKIGDKVKFLNDIGGGTVTGFQDNKYVLIETDDGFDLPILAAELVLLDSDQEKPTADRGSKANVTGNTKAKESEISKIAYENYKFEEFKGDAVLAIVPENAQLLHVSDFKIFLVNDSAYSLQYIVYQDSSVGKTLLKSGSVGPNSKVAITRISQTEISKIKALGYQGLFYKAGLFTLNKPLQRVYDVENVNFYKTNTFDKNAYFHDLAMILSEQEFDLKNAIDELSKNDVFKVIKAKEDVLAQKPKEVKKIYNDIEEVDLHIEQILDSHSGLSNGEIITIQLDRFETSLATAIKSTTKKIVFIHGVGNGKLKHELRKILERKYSQFQFQDASFKEYGYGATMVYLK